jgi:hypothetical protein
MIKTRWVFDLNVACLAAQLQDDRPDLEPPVATWGCPLES